MKHKLEPIAYRLDIGRASYVLDLVDGEFWDAKRYECGRMVTCVWAEDEEGSPICWGSLEEAHRACEMHAEFVDAGVEPVIAVLDVQRALREERAA